VFLVLALVVAAGAVAGRFAGRFAGPRGRVGSAAGVPTAVPWLLGAALAPQVALRLLPAGVRTGAGPLLVGASAVLVAGALVLVARRGSPLRAAAVLALAGGGLNAAVMLANGGMPVSTAAVERAGLDPAFGADDPTARHVALDGDTRLTLLADVVPLRVGPERAVFSLGDAVLLAAAASGAHATARHPRAG
jgi:hypothetical protein